MAKLVKCVNFNSDRKVDELLIRKLNAIAPYLYDDITGAARKLLHEKLDERLAEYGITVDYSQPASVAG